jgi:GLPGLI family protein
MKRILTIFSVIQLFFFAEAGAQQKFTEGTITYTVTVNSNDPNPKIVDGFDGATNTVYIKGKLIRSDLVSIFGSQTTIIDGRTGKVVVLKQYGDNKFMIVMSPGDWMDANTKYDSVKFKFENDFKNILGYKCQKAVGTLRSGEEFTVYFTPSLVPLSQDFQYSIRSLPGLALEYESVIGKSRVTFTATNISFNPVPAAKFDLPKSGFRVLSYQESKSSGK